MISVLRNVYDFCRYGKRIGKVNRDGSVLRKGNGTFGAKGTRYLINRNGDVNKIIKTERHAKDAFLRTEGTRIKKDSMNRWDITATYYNQAEGYKQINETKFKGQYNPERNSWISSGNPQSIEHTSIITDEGLIKNKKQVLMHDEHGNQFYKTVCDEVKRLIK